MAFIRFSIIDANNNHTISQRVVPLRRMLPGYRHLRLRNMQNHPLELASLFIHMRHQIEHVADQMLLSNQKTQQQQQPSLQSGLFSSTSDLNANSVIGAGPKGGKHKHFKLTVYGLSGDDEENDNGVQVKVTQETTVQQVIEQVR